MAQVAGLLLRRWAPRPSAGWGGDAGSPHRHGGHGASGGGARRISGSASAARGGEAAGGDDIRRAGQLDREKPEVSGGVL